MFTSLICDYEGNLKKKGQAVKWNDWSGAFLVEIIQCAFYSPSRRRQHISYVCDASWRPPTHPAAGAQTDPTSNLHYPTRCLFRSPRGAAEGIFNELGSLSCHTLPSFIPLIYLLNRTLPLAAFCSRCRLLPPHWPELLKNRAVVWECAVNNVCGRLYRGH